MTYVTLELLDEIGACGEARKWFSVTYPNGVELTRESLDSCPKPDWVWWLGCRLDKSGMLIWNAPNIAFREATRVCPELQEWVRNVGPDNREEAADAARAAWEAAWAAAWDAAADAAWDAAWDAADAVRAAWAATDAAADAAETELREIASQSLLGLGGEK